MIVFRQDSELDYASTFTLLIFKDIHSDYWKAFAISLIKAGYVIKHEEV